MRVATAVATLLLLAAACAPVQTAPPPADSTTDGVRLTASPEGARTVRLILDNGTRSPIGYNLCHSQLQRNAGGSWTGVETDEVCTMELRTLNPGFDATFDKTLPPALPAGEYRYVTRVESPLGTPQRPVPSNSFRVTG